MIQKFLETNYTLIEKLKENVSLIYDKKNRRLCIMKNIRADSIELYKNLKKLKNPYIPQIYHIFEDFIIEEHIAGKNLSEILDCGEILSDEKIFSILRQLCQCLKILHKNKIIHRDIKPSNLILTNDEIIKLIDFGIARQMKENIFSDTEWLGTRGYAPPEQYGFSQTDCRSDIYAVGATLQLFQPKSSRLQKIIRKATNFNPDERFQSVDEILFELQGKNNFLGSLKNLFRKNFDEQNLEEILHEKLLSFKIILPDVEDYYFRKKNYSLAKRLNYPDDYQYIYDDEKSAFIAGALSFDEHIFSKMDEYIKKVWAMYEKRQLKNFCTYEIAKENFYHKTNREVEKQIAEIFSLFDVKDIPKNLLEFKCVPEFEKIKFDYVEKVREKIESLHSDKGLEAYLDYVETQKTSMRNVPRKYAFHIDKAVDVMFGDILWATEFFTKTSDDLRENIHKIIREHYLKKFREELKNKSEEIKNFLIPILQK
ncbi:MAG: serine/threonine protein kinase [Selenomonadaceae bacterium]|nr:serine/threonine protein kinase [Selenomonadaceae bacterium]